MIPPGILLGRPFRFPIMADPEKKKYPWSQIYRRPAGIIDVSETQADGDNGEEPKRRPMNNPSGTPCS